MYFAAEQLEYRCPTCKTLAGQWSEENNNADPSAAPTARQKYVTVEKQILSPMRILRRQVRQTFELSTYLATLGNV